MPALPPPRSRRFAPSAALATGLILLLAGALLAFTASPGSAEPQPQPSLFHPLFPLLDESGENVLISGKPVSTMQTCGACHDTEFIESHSLHANAGLDALHPPGEDPGSRPWDIGPGPYGRWNPIAYRALSSPGDSRFDLGTAEWIQVYGPRHVGGGPAMYSASGVRLDQLALVPGDPQTNSLDPESGDSIPWDWNASGVVEMNCFLCHTPSPNNEARVEALHEGEFRWSATATLLGSGIVEGDAGAYRWLGAGFDQEGNVRGDLIGIQDPSNDNCGLCHGLVHDVLQGPLAVSGCVPERYRTVTSGQIISSQRLADSGMNLQGKEDLDRSWDIHAERLLSCTDCHYSLNNPVYFLESEASLPEHLTFDPRRLELGEYLYQPVHDFARGHSAQSNLTPELQGTMRRCESCHSMDATHDWLPYKEQHAEVLACESCHIPKLYSNALQSLDWTVLTLDKRPRNECRGIEGDPESFAALITGYQPAILPQQELDGGLRFAPFNLVTTWFWVYGDPPRPVRLMDLELAWFEGETYHPQVLELFDRDGDGALQKAELVLDTAEKQEFIAGRLRAQGIEDPRILGEVQPYSVNHDVATDEWAVADCQVCHGPDSRLSQTIRLSTDSPVGAEPAFVGDTSFIPSGEIVRDPDGAFAYRPSTEAQGIYVFGKDAVSWIDRLGGFAFLGVLAGVTAHGGLRFFSGLRARRPNPGGEAVYMYGLYERLWHWLQTFTIVALLFTGLIIHNPELFAVFSFRHVVLVHNILAGILATNAALALFYHLASGEIQQFLPRPVGFFDQTIRQARYYLRGIYRGDPHPFHKRPGEKLNPLQQITYLAILNVLLPLQGITGALMWGAQHWPDLASRLGGLPFLAPLHTLVAWLFAAFIVMHVYLTTTGRAPLTNIRAMMLGWEQVQAHQPEEADVA